jgi:ABC-2 type transport system ATP-binding protein
VPVVETHSLTKRFGNRVALDRVDVTIGSGVTGLLGANGAGKTTLLRILLGLSQQDDGTLRVLDRDPRTDGAAVRARVGWSAEHDSLPPDMRAQDLVRHLAEIHGLPRRAALGRASDALYEVGLAEERFRAVGTMSTGQRQRVKLAMAIAHDPKLVLLDEPTNGLDPLQREDMLRLVRRVGTEFGLDVVVSSHLLGEVERICDGVVMLAEGRVVSSGRIAELRTGDDRLAVEIDGDTRAIAAALEGDGFAVEVADDGALLLVVDGEERVFDALRDAIAARGAGLVRLQRRTATLEDLFLAGIARADDDDAGRGATA